MFTEKQEQLLFNSCLYIYIYIYYSFMRFILYGNPFLSQKKKLQFLIIAILYLPISLHILQCDFISYNCYIISPNVILFYLKL